MRRRHQEPGGGRLQPTVLAAYLIRSRILVLDDGVAELDVFALDAALPPVGVLPRQPEDERLDLGRDARAPARIPVSAGPRLPDQLAVPGGDGTGLEQRQLSVKVALQTGGQARQLRGQDSERALLGAREARRVRALQQAPPVSQEQELQVLVAGAPPPDGRQVNDARREMREHGPVAPAILRCY